jgi:hypothetical protein
MWVTKAEQAGTGQIPDYALNATGQLDATTYFYKQL